MHKKQDQSNNHSHTEQADLGNCPSLTLIIEALEAFQSFDAATRAGAIALCASELEISQLHFYVIALHLQRGAA